MRGTASPDMASSTSAPSARACLYASIRAWIPAESQNVVRVMSTTNAAAPWLASSSAARSPAVLVTSISAGTRTTGTPLTNSTGKLSPRIGITSRDR